MKPWWKVLLVLAFVLPVGGYVVGSLVAGSVDDPAPRAPMQLRPAGDGEASPTTEPSTPPTPDPSAPTPEATPDPTRGADGAATDDPIPVEPRLGDLDDRGGDRGGDRGVDDDDDDRDDDDDAGDDEGDDDD